MPTDFGDITAYHRHEASRYYALAQAARDQGNIGKAEYLVAMAARHAEAAQEQQTAMMLEPGLSTEKQTPNQWSL
jgi:invasion protein IalB